MSSVTTGKVAPTSASIPHAAADDDNNHKDLSGDDGLPWKTVGNAEFDEVVARIIVNPQTALDNVFLRRDSDGSTLLHVIAGWSRCQDLVAQLLIAGLPVDVRDASGWTPLLEAAQEGQIETCKVLLAHRAMPDLAVNELTPLRAAAEVGNAEMVTWLLTQPGTWAGTWDNHFFAFLLEKTPSAVPTLLDAFAMALNHSKRGYTAVKYTNLRQIYGEPDVPVAQTALALAVQSANARDVLAHRVMRYLVRAKWKAFGKSMFRREFSAYCALLVAYFVPTVWADPDWTRLDSAFDYWVALSRAVSWLCCAYLLVHVERNEFLGAAGAINYFRSFWNILNLTTYVAVIATIPLEFVASLASVRNCALALITVALWLNLLQFLQMATDSGLLIAMMSHMATDVYRFLLLYAVFLFGFSGAFYILLRGAAGFENFTNSFLSVFLLLYGQITFDTFNNTTGWVWHTTMALMVVHLVGVVIVLLNILIAMMATTYADVYDSAEVQALTSHAQAIVRMETSLPRSERVRVFERLLRVDMRHVLSRQKTAAAAAATRLSKIGNQTQIGSTAELLASRSNRKRSMLANISTHLHALTSPSSDAHGVVNLVRRKLPSRASTTSSSLIHPTESTAPTRTGTILREGEDDDVPQLTSNAASHRRQSTHTANNTGTDSAKDHHTATRFLEALIETPNLQLTALEESLFLKSALDQDDEVDNNGHGGSPTTSRLAVLEDGVRYELPTKRRQDDGVARAIADLETQVAQFAVTLADVQQLLRDERTNTVRAAALATPRLS